MENYRLEYKEKTGQFHLQYNRKTPPNTHGWKTVFENIDDKKANLFFDLIEYGFPFKIVKHKFSFVWYKAQLFNKIINTLKND